MNEQIHKLKVRASPGWWPFAPISSAALLGNALSHSHVLLWSTLQEMEMRKDQQEERAQDLQRQLENMTATRDKWIEVASRSRKEVRHRPPCHVTCAPPCGRLALGLVRVA